MCRFLSSAGFSLWGFVFALTNPHRLKPALLARTDSNRQHFHRRRRESVLQFF